MKTARGFLKPCFAAAGIAVVLAAFIGLLVDGPAAAGGAAAGVALASLGFAASVWAVAGAEKIDFRLTLPVALVTYTVKLTVFAIALWAVKSTGWDVVWPMAVGIIGGAIVWLTTQGIWLYRAKIPYIELSDRT
ncbi:hypothetical protein L0U85_11280 [Glycomyces sp. L485]|uniref:hypothetical protein n=1 Tax=Glycomyces sp. L485 TaxID=2909235 RepID=UPI001F4A6799|nr:hypothetical protein [Glycomyces sp. L485]MCH7231426.1 hypothetical protein [Glycomyces sp. L485]